MDRLFNLEPALTIAESRLRKMPMTLQEQVSELYETLRDDVFRYLLLLGAGHEQAQELCQETFLRLYTELRKGTRLDSPRAWVFTVARNCATAAMTSSAAFESIDASLEDQLAASSPTPERSALDREKLQRLHKAVCALSHQQRHCLHLRAEGFRYREIAEIIGISTSSVGEFLRRAVSRLRKELYD
jgi:RNA polymerase sigma-70 factor (ECF subfamily)